MALAQWLGDDHVERLADSLGGGVAEHALGAGVPKADGPLRVGGDDRVAGARQDRGGKLLLVGHDERQRITRPRLSTIRRPLLMRPRRTLVSYGDPLRRTTTSTRRSLVSRWRADT